MIQLFILEPTTTGVDFLLGKHVLFTGFITYVLIVVIFLSLLTIITGLFILRMKNLRSTISTTTYKLQIMLFKTLLVHRSITIGAPRGRRGHITGASIFSIFLHLY